MPAPTNARPLKGIRKVAREQAEATVVDAEAYGHLGNLKLATELVSIYRSTGLPGLTMSEISTSGADSSGLVAKISKAMPAMCKGNGKDLCKSFGVKEFTPADGTLYQKLAKRYR